MTTPAALVRFFEPWSSLYSDSKLVATLVVFGHIASMLFAGGLAITLDRATLRAVRAMETRAHQLAEIAAAHRIVIGGLAFSAVTGLLLFASDVETYFVSWVYWTKMALIVLLLTNGWYMKRAEVSLRSTSANAEPGWKRLRMTAMVSLFLWFAIALAGVALVNAA